MKTPPAELLARLLTAFRAEAEEHVQVLTTGLVDLETAPPDARANLVERMFRSAHSLKGAARTVNLQDVEALCQRIESVFVQWKRQPPAPDPAQFDLLHQAVALIGELTRSPTERPSGTSEASALIERLRLLVPESSPITPASPKPVTSTPAPTPAPSTEAPSADVLPTGSIRVEADRIEQMLYGVEEMLHLKHAFAQRVNELRLLIERGAASDLANSAATTPSVETPDQTQGGDARLRLTRLFRDLERDRSRLVKLVDQLRDDSRTLLLMPFGTHAGFFAKLVRDLGRDQGRPVDFVVHGREVEVDKRILDEIKDPLIHLLRNCIAHGLESPDVRRSRGKSERGRVELSVAPAEGQKIEISVADDGAGIDFEAIRRSAERAGLLANSTGARPTEAELLSLLFRSEFSTAAGVTEISGRGIGLAVVQERVDRLGGQISIETRAGKGTTFRLRLPVTQTALRGVPVAVGSQEFVLPATQIESVVRIRPDSIKTVQNRDTIVVNQRTLSLAWLGALLGVPHRPRPSTSDAFITVVIVNSGGMQLAFAVDDVRQESEMLVKPFRPPLRRVHNYLGATLDGADRVLPILRVSDLLNSATRGTAPARPTPVAPTVAESRRRRVLVAEDSVTSRILLKDILESAGYDVATAVDGLDALTTLRSETFDLLVSDVEMPRLDGVALTAAVRADDRLKEIPVILVTALASREDRERGFDAGANAYIVKSRFDQSDLLEVVGRFA